MTEDKFVDDIVEEDIIEEEPEKIELDTFEVTENLKVEITEEDQKKYDEELKKKRGRKKKDIPTPSELDQMSDEEVIADAPVVLDDFANPYYEEFNLVLEDKCDIKQDTGIKATLPTGIDLLDTIMGGGFAIGTIGMVLGTPGCGKSMLAMQTLGNAQLKYKGQILCSYLDSEESTTTARLANLGVKFPKIRPYNDIYLEKVFKFIETLCIFKETKKIVEQPSVVVWDSVANTLTLKEREIDDVNSAIGYKARYLSLLLPKYVAKISQYNIALLVINQLRDQVAIGPIKPAKQLSFLRQGKTVPGGNSLLFNSFHLLDMKSKSAIDSDKYGFEGMTVEVNFVKNKSFPPNLKVDLIGDFVRGFSNFWTNYNFLVENKRLTPGGYNYLNNYPTKKFRTKDAKSLYDSDPEFKYKFDESVKETIDTEWIKRYDISEN